MKVKVNYGEPDTRVCEAQGTVYVDCSVKVATTEYTIKEFTKNGNK